MTAFLDTDVLVDCLRGSEPAKAWLNSSAGEAFELPGVVAMELVIGCRDQRELQHIKKFLSTFVIAWPTPEESAFAFDVLAEHRLRNGLSIPDAIIAAMTINRSATLFGFNARHYAGIHGLRFITPYERN